ncbi:phosphoribosyltransferase domain-containing protein [Sphingomonas sp. A2-49]|uniref:phosphoribosyltransferase n=1 Tax=Sphingomonas sp. A2-49 TaxID=1391375 RepID=UPI0021CF6BAE|nr:phosphoribosyltransferase domain-containing protein [Sphingomonas sp. A2-49]MCU6455935.1 phosphoribosyltransferase domain-containing protein [Sphingomonas sp. A2-49]
MPVFTLIPHDDFVAAVHALAAAIRDAGWTPDFIIGIGRGGLAPAVYLSHATGLPMLSVDYSSQVDDFAEAPLVRLAERTRAGEKLLFIDDINDSGRTIAHIRGTLAAAGATAAVMRFATLIDNASSAERVDYRARTIDRRTMKDWFVFPWEAVAPSASIEQDAAEVPDRIA